MHRLSAPLLTCPVRLSRTGLLWWGLLVAACGKTTPGPAPVAATSSYAGTVVLYDEFGYRLADKSGVSVTDRASGNAAVTDVSGAFNVVGLPAGERELAFAKPGYGTFRRHAVSVAGATVAPDPVALGQVSTTQCSGGGTSTDERRRELSVYGQQSPAGSNTYPRGRRLFFKRGTSVAASPTDYDATIAVPAKDGPTFKDVLDYLLISDAGVKPGDYYTYAVYGDNPLAAYYLDPVSKRAVFPALAPGSTARGILRYQ